MNNEWKNDYEPVKEPKIGESYHLSWAYSSGYVWKLKEILPNGKVKLITRRTRKELIANASDLIHLKRKSIEIRNKAAANSLQPPLSEK